MPINHYKTKTSNSLIGHKEHSIWDYWESGDIDPFRPTSITPSIHVPLYRKFILNLISNLTLKNESTTNILSVGCGNCLLEKELTEKLKNKIQISGIDYNEDAVEFARKRGFKVDCLNLLSKRLLEKVSFNLLNSFDLVLSDGLMGHLYKTDIGYGSGEINSKLKLLKSFLSKNGKIIISGESPRYAQSIVEKHYSVPDFYLFGEEYFKDSLSNTSMKLEKTFNFPYERPGIGMLNRLIIVIST